MPALDLNPKPPAGAKPWAPNLFGKQMDVFTATDLILLVDGPRFSAKSWAVSHKVIRHLWLTPAASFGIFAKSVKLAKDAGSWQMLLETILPEWTAANLIGRDGKPFEILSKTAEGLPGPKVDANTRTAYFDVRNYWGGRSRCMLFSINNENEVEEKVKNKNFSGMWFIELSMWKERKLLPITLASLRMPGYSQYEDQYLQWIADTNPDETLGRNSWIYQVFYVERNKPLEADAATEEQELLREYYQMMRVITLHWKDNIYFTRKQQVRLLGSCRGEPALKEAYYDGKWGAGGFETKFHFRHLFIESQHVIGGKPGEGDQIDVRPSTTRLHSGWDIGSVNHACILLDRWTRQAEVVIEGKTQMIEQVCWSVLDEIIHIGSGLAHDQCVRLSDFAPMALENMRALERLNNHTYEWTHWADDSALNVFRPGSESAYDYLEILKHTENRIHLQGVHKPAHSRRTRVRMLSQLLSENRIFISSRCTHVIAMLQNLSQSVAQYIVKNDYVHPFDALTYPIFAEMQVELLDQAFAPTATLPTRAEDAEVNQIISV